MVQFSWFRLLGLAVSLVVAVTLPLTASAATHASAHHRAPAHHISCGHDYIGSNGGCSLNIAALGIVGAADTPGVAIVHIGSHGYVGANLDAEIDPQAIEIVAPSTSPAAAASYVAQQLRQYAASGQPIHLVVTVGGTIAVSPAYNRAIGPAVVPAATQEVGGANAVDGTLALADMLMLYQRGGISAVRENLAGLASVATYGYGTLLWPARH